MSLIEPPLVVLVLIWGLFISTLAGTTILRCWVISLGVTTDWEYEYDCDCDCCDWLVPERERVSDDGDCDADSRTSWIVWKSYDDDPNVVVLQIFDLMEWEEDLFWCSWKL